MSNWLSVDPLMRTDAAFDSKETTNGGVFNSKNNSVYAFSYNNPVKYIDPDGNCPNCITAGIGAAIGGLIGGGIEAGTQIYENGKVTNWKAVGGSALQGGLTGGAAGFTGGSSLLVTGAAVGTANAVGAAANRAIQGKGISVGNVVMDATLGAIFGAGGKYLGGVISRSRVDRWAKIGSTGVIGENALKKLGGTSQSYLKTTLGGRYVDQLVNGIAHESKVGYTSLTSSIRGQISKDSQIINKSIGGVKGAVWHFFKSPKTGKVGASQPLLNELKKNGINYIIHK